MKRERDEFRKSSCNIVIPFRVRESDEQYILGNFICGKISLIDEREYTALRKFPNTQDDTTILNLKNEGYITCLTEEEEKTLLKEMYENLKTPTDPRAAIVLTYQCNLRCTYCWVDHLFVADSKWTKTIIDEKTVDAAFKAITDIPALESVKIMSLYGGEPFLPSTYSMVRYIMEKASGEVAFHANTNGYYLKKFVPLLAQYTIAGLGVTLDGIPPVHDARRKKVDGCGTFDQIVKGIDAALDAGISIGVRINVDGSNISHLPAFGDWIKEHGWTHQKDIAFVSCFPSIYQWNL